MLLSSLRQQILDRAIRGQLVPQLPEEGTAEELYQQIQAEKKALIANGTIKKEKPLEPIQEGDIPFEIPATWKWVKFGELVINRDSERIPLSLNERNLLAKTYDYYGASGVIDKVDRYLFDKPLLLIGEDGANLLTRSKPIAFIAQGKYWVNNHAHLLDVGEYMALEYLELYINAISLVPYVTGSAQPKMNQERMNTIPIALPPLKEQRRIIESVKSIFEGLSSIESSQKRISAIQTELTKRILDQAIQGKLVPQLPEEGTAEELYQQIQAEKQRLIAAGTIKKEKPLPPIEEKDLPFDIPETWKWVRLGDCTNFGQTKQKTRATDISDDTWIADLEDIEKSSGRLLRRITSKERKIAGDKTIFKKGDILFSKLRPYLQKILIANESGVCTSELVPFSSYGDIDPQYLLYVLKSPTVDGTINTSTYGMKMPRVGRDTMLSLLIPLPPLAEQQRIVAKIEEMLTHCKTLQ